MIENLKVFDCVPFYQSNLLFELRLKTLINIVDKFVVCEATKTHAGERKDLVFDLDRFKDYKDRINYIVVENMPNKLNNSYEKYPLYNFQIDKLQEGISDLNDEDLLIISDEDEIPNPLNILNFDYKNYKYGIFLQKLYYYKLNIQNIGEHDGSRWPGSRICKKKNLKSFSWFRSLKTKNINRPLWKFWKEKNIQLIENGGWHFTYLMNYSDISKKIKSSEHSEFNKEKFTNVIKIKNRINNLIDPFDRNNKLIKVGIDETYPEYILNNQQYYEDWIIK